MPGVVYAIATMDSKGDEVAFVAEQLQRLGLSVVTVNVGTFGPATINPDIDRDRVLQFSSIQSASVLKGMDRGQAIDVMSQALAGFLKHEFAEGKVSGVIGLGGSGGTALISPALRALPIGLPKLLVSTVASGNTSPYVDCSDITLVYSVVDVAGLNSVSVKILGNAAHAMAGMVSHPVRSGETRPAIGMTMFGVTTPCVTAVRQALEAKDYDCLVFHATGTGGRAMEQLVESGLIRGVLDITTTEVADEVVGGVFAAGPKRFDRLLARRVPLVLSVGALDMVNFGERNTIPDQFQQRNLHVHNAQVTLMRTNIQENRRIARWIADKLNRSVSPLTLLLPELGVSMLDAPGQPFNDPDADAALFAELEACIVPSDTRRVIRLPYHINDPEFAQALVTEFEQAMSLSRGR